MKLAQLLDFQISRLTLDSRACDSQTLFVAAPPATPDSKDGHDFVSEAIKNGAPAVVVEHDIAELTDVPVFVVENARKFIAVAAEHLQGEPSRRLTISGITGTNGKTSTSFFLASILKHAGLKPAVVGTFGIGDIAAPHYNGFTTPEAEILSPALTDLCEQGFSHVAMEVSSHALELFRCDGIHFAAAAFLNLSPEHLDFHHDMLRYRKAKERLFLELLPRGAPAVIPYGDALVSLLKGRGHRVITFGRSPDADIHVDQIGVWRGGLSARIHVGAKNALVEMPVSGDFNLDNVMCAAGLAYAQGVAAELIFDALPQLVTPPGRLERVQVSKKAPSVIVDFSHKPVALQKALLATRALAGRSLKVVFGCGGNRDPHKRPMMGQIAAELADEIWITNDNPRHEDPLKIIDAIVSGIDPALRYKCHVVPDRAQAIAEAISGAHFDDAILIAGKGDENTQQVGDVYTPFKDKDVARESLEAWRP